MVDIIPGLKCFGGTTRAAYGNSQNPTICIVNTLNTSTAIQDSYRNGIAVKTGGLKSCIDLAVDNKMILFEVSGNIVYDGTMWLDDNYVTIAGQTAPSPGVTLVGTKFEICSHDVLVQHLRIRIGKYSDRGDYGNLPNVRQNLRLSDHNTVCGGISDSYNKIGDHLTLSWGEDQTAGMGGSGDITYANTIFSEPLYENSAIFGYIAGRHLAVHESVNPSMIVDCLFAHGGFRGPKFDNSGNPIKFLFSNNLIYNAWEYSNIQIGSATKQPVSVELAFVGNVLKHGLTNPTVDAQRLFIDEWDRVHADSKFHLFDNQVDEYISSAYTGNIITQSSADDWSSITSYKAGDANENGWVETNCKVTSMPFPYPSGYIPIPSSEVEAHIISNVGAYPAFRDVVDARIISEVQNRTGRKSDCVKIHAGDSHCNTAEKVTPEGDWPTLEENNITLNIPANPHVVGGDGYTNLEKFLHALADEVEGKIPVPSAKGQIVSLTYPVTVDHGAMCDINAAIKNIGELSGSFKTQILINSILLATSPEFNLEGGATSTDKIDPFKAPLSGESMDIIIKCIRSE
jgi:hypothetical protein